MPTPTELGPPDRALGVSQGRPFQHNCRASRGLQIRHRLTAEVSASFTDAWSQVTTCSVSPLGRLMATAAYGQACPRSVMVSPAAAGRALGSTLRVWLETRDSSTLSDPVDVKSSLCPPSFWSPSPLQSEDSAFSNNREEVVEFFTVCLNQDLCSPGPERREARGDASH